MASDNALQGILSQVTAGLNTPVKTAITMGQNFGLKAADFSSVGSMTSALGRVAESYGPNGTALFGRHVLTSALGRQDPIMTYCWFCDLPKVNGLTLDWSYVEEFTAPMRSFDVLPQYQRGQMFHFAGTKSISGLSIKCYDDSTGKAGAYLEGWRNLVSSPDGKVNYPGGTNGYKQDIRVTILDVSRAIQVYTLLYKGCWPTTADPISLQSSESTRSIQSQEFSVDTLEMTVRKVPVADFATSLVSSVNNFPGSITQLASNAFKSLTG